MSGWRTGAAAVLGMAALAASASAQTAVNARTSAKAPPPPASPVTGAVPPSVKPAERLPGYLGKEGVPNSILILPPPPVAGTTLDKLDNETYAATRKMDTEARGVLAARDATHYVQAFDCPLGIKLEDGPTAVGRLFLRVGRDAAAITNLAKDHFKHARPFIKPNGAICTESDRAGLIKSFSYPSGHTTYSWAMGLILAEIAPDKASDILARARSFGESRVVCGVHTVSDVEEGRTNGAALVAALHANPEFQADLAAAKSALATARAAPHPAPDAGECKVEKDAEEHTPWINPTAAK